MLISLHKQATTTPKIRAILDGHPRSRIEDLMPWRYPQQPSSLAA
jgi:hypothetical protein